MKERQLVEGMLGLIDIPCIYFYSNNKDDCVSNNHFINAKIHIPTLYSQAIENHQEYAPRLLPYDRDKTKHLLSLPVYGNKKTGKYIFVINMDDKSYLIDKKVWHEVNNPLAILTMLISKLRRKNYLDQNDVDKTLRISEEQAARIKSGIHSMIIEEAQ